jgi:plasmid stability protein
MDDLLIEDIDDGLVRELHDRALRNGRTVDQEVIYRLERGLALEAKTREVGSGKDKPISSP